MKIMIISNVWEIRIRELEHNKSYWFIYHIDYIYFLANKLSPTRQINAMMYASSIILVHSVTIVGRKQEGGELFMKDFRKF